MRVTNNKKEKAAATKAKVTVHRSILKLHAFISSRTGAFASRGTGYGWYVNVNILLENFKSGTENGRNKNENITIYRNYISNLFCKIMSTYLICILSAVEIKTDSLQRLI